LDDEPNLLHEMIPVVSPNYTIPSGELTYPTLGKEKSSSKLAFQGMLVPRRVDVC